MNCASCGISMIKAEDHGASDIHLMYCRHCAPDGVLKSRDSVRGGWIQFVITAENISREEAEKKVDMAMGNMPAWRK